MYNAEQESNLFFEDRVPTLDLSIHPIKLGVLMKTEFTKTEWLVENLIPIGGLVAISGTPSSFKTWLALYLGTKISCGEEALESFKTKECGVLMVDEESGLRWLKPRMSKLDARADLPIYFLSKTGFKLTNQSVDELIHYAKENDIGLLIFDSLVRIHNAKDENSAIEMAKVFGMFQRLTREGLSVIFIHHSRKQGFGKSNPSQDMRGSSDILAAVDCHLSIVRKDTALIVTQTKLRHAEEMKPFKLNIISESGKLDFEFAGEMERTWGVKDDMKNAIESLLKSAEEPLYKKEMFETLKASGVLGGQSTFKMGVDELVEKKVIYTKRGEKNKTFCSITPFDSDDNLGI